MKKFSTIFLVLLLQCGVCHAAPWDWCRWALERLGGQSRQSTVRETAPSTIAGPHRAASDVQLKDLPGRLDFLLGVLRQHPNLVTSNLSFRRSLLDTLSHVTKVQKLLGNEAASMEAKQTSLLRAVYLPSGDSKYDEALLADFLGQRAKELEGLGLLPGADLGAQLTHLKESSKKEGGGIDEKGFKRKATRLFRLLPFLFDSNGKARFTDLSDATERERISKAIREHSPQTLSNAYGDLLKEHLAKQIESASEAKGMGQLKHWFETTKNDFVGKEVKRVLTPVGEGGTTVTTRTLTAERLPNSVALFRGCYGGDCSILSVPYYPLVKDTRSYFLRKGDDPDTEPSGYVFSTLVEVGGKKVPYILTVNGATLTKSDVEMAVRMVAKDWGSDEVVLADMDKNPRLVNTTDTREGMKWGGKKIAVKFSKGWNLAENYMNENPAKDLNGNTYKNYYHSSTISDGYLVNVAGADKRLAEPIGQSTGDVSRYGFGKKAGDEPLLERAVLASQASSDPGISAREQGSIRSHLNVSKPQADAAQPLVEMSEKRALTPAEFHTAERELGFDIKGVLARDVATRALTLRALYEAEPELLTEHLRLGSERLMEGLAHAYRIEDPALVADLFKLPELTPKDTLTALRHLPQAYVGKPEAILEVTKALPASHQQMILGNIASGIASRSVTQNALGTRLISGLESKRKAREVFQTLIEQHGSKLPSSPMTLAVTEIAKRMERDRVNYYQAESAWLKDGHVNAGEKAVLVKARRRMGESESKLMNEIPTNQRPEVIARLREGTNLDVFEKLAENQGGHAEEFTVAKRESFEFEAFHFPSAGGKFRLGSPGDEAGRFDNESQRDVVLKNSFEMQATPITWRQWRAVMGNERQPNFKDNADNPMEQISWDDAVAYAKRLSELDPKYDYRLPTEAEWEVAARAGTTTRFSYGDDEKELGQHAWTDANSKSKTHPVGELKPNANGLYDMHGNVWEWCSDWYGSNLPEGVDPQGPTTGSARVVRGGSWYDGARYARSAGRNAYLPGNRNYALGARLVRTPK